jgi:hypothetical protein
MPIMKELVIRSWGSSLMHAAGKSGRRELFQGGSDVG